jgi:hypothetical protein
MLQNKPQAWAAAWVDGEMGKGQYNHFSRAQCSRIYNPPLAAKASAIFYDSEMNVNTLTSSDASPLLELESFFYLRSEKNLSRPSHYHVSWILHFIHLISKNKKQF